MLKQISDLMSPRGFKIRFSSGLKRFLAKNGFSEEYGARELKRLIKREVEDLLAEKILDGDLLPGSVFVRMRGRKVLISNETVRERTVV